MKEARTGRQTGPDRDPSVGTIHLVVMSPGVGHGADPRRRTVRHSRQLARARGLKKRNKMEKLVNQTTARGV